MDCKKAKNLMSAYVDGMLESAEKSAFEAHIHTCKDCERELELLKSTLNLLADAKYSAPENFTYEVREKLKSDVPEKSAHLRVSEKFFRLCGGICHSCRGCNRKPLSGKNLTT
ncbi:MAG: zf-HC2 domain-containing protein [Clostridiales bacterium]|nr:MAG: zf-HC2 domain-containing protein [Clostridiales bacterium]